MKSSALAPKLSSEIDRSGYLEHLGNIALFQDIKNIPEAMVKLCEVIEEKHFTTGQEIIKEGATGSDVYFLISGKVSIFKSTPSSDQYKVAELSATAHPFFGEGGLIDAEERSATIRADTDCYCLTLNKDRFVQYCNSHPQWALPIFRRIAFAVMNRFRRTNNDLMLLYNALVAEIRGHQ